MNKELLEKYAFLKIEEKRIKKEIDALNPEVKKMIVDSGNDKVVSDFGSFTISPVSVWKYTKAVEDKEKEVEKLKEEEKARGLATSDVRYDLRFTAKKKQEDE